MSGDALVLEALVRDAVARTTVDPPSSFSWFGRRETPCPAPLRGTMTAGQLRDALARGLAARLYEHFYCAGHAVAGSADQGSADSEDPAWVARLARANRSTECRDEGWIAIRREGRTLVVRKDGLILRVDRRSTRPGTRGLSIVMPAEYRKLSPGFYMAASHAPLSSHAPLFRVYWNLDVEGAVLLVRCATQLLNDAGLPFRLKVAAHPAAFTRCDAAVLYAARRDRVAVFEQLGRMRRVLERYLEPASPVFTKTIAPGIAIAEEPPTGESFGESRCRVLAEGLIRCGRSRGTDHRFERIRSLFGRRGIPFHRAHLNPGSRDVYPPLPA